MSVAEVIGRQPCPDPRQDQRPAARGVLVSSGNRANRLCWLPWRRGTARRVQCGRTTSGLCPADRARRRPRRLGSARCSLTAATCPRPSR